MVQPKGWINPQGEESMPEAKSYVISKQVVWEAYQKVKANRGAAGVDGESIEAFEQDLKNNLYKIWNRMSSGSYFPPPVRVVEIPKASGGLRPLGIPTVGDRVAQMVVKMHLEPLVEPHFHPDSYGYRPGKSALDAVATARQRCWRYDWVIDLDIKGFFDNLEHSLIMRAVKKHTNCEWMILYIERWLKAPVQLEDGTLVERDRGTPQGSVISPLLANLFMHHAFDKWMQENHPYAPFERYADDVVVHCKSEQQAKYVLTAIAKRLAQCKLELHPEKTRIVYRKDGERKGSYEHQRFTSWGLHFDPDCRKT
jgi:RNA-directed DNA polymerase